MNTAIIIIGMLAAFLLGAEIRQPFNFIPRKPSKQTISELKNETEREKRLKAQWDNLLQYDGTTQEEGEEE